ncbi:class I SAM-dependent methyltransferase [Aureimonas populi]|uniref:Class I SAM-dependent methyltransferase n=1 Tax=Aureimonas populi TaxID=1701758 RepID=A0ABW5CIA7_9HYPH|nr:SAM-dependent methyltransferase [Aureimonas populi]
MTPLGRRIAEAIASRGPMSLERFWNIALFDPQGGYYTARRPFGAEGDFITAPEISQMFGELLGAWLVAAWRKLGRPSPFVLAEIGPGRGTLMADLLRTTRRLDPAFAGAARLWLVETSDRLAGEQAAALARFDLPVRRARRLAEVEDGPLLLVANELFDAVAIRQFVFGAEGWRERLVSLDGEALRFVEGEAGTAHPLPGAGTPAPGDVAEVSPLREAIAAEIGSRLARRPGAALLIDYGHARSGFGDTLQALRAHAFADPLADPGLHDITSHVDFARLSAALAGAGASVSPVGTQGEFLLSLGLAERAARLARDRGPEDRARVASDARRLAGGGPGEMGALFKVLAAASRPLALPPFGAGGLD